MYMILKIGFRNIFRQRRRTILTMLTMIGGFVLAAVSIGWSDGTYSYIIDMFTRNQLGHIQLHGTGYLDRPSLYTTIERYGSVGAVIDGIEGVERWAPRIYSAGLVSIGEKSAGARIIGIDPERENGATRFDRKITDGRPFAAAPGGEAIIGTGLAHTLGAAPGDELVLVTQAADGSIANDLYSIVGLAESGDQMQDQSSVYLPLPVAQELLVLPDEVHEIAVIINELDDVQPMVKRIRAAIDNPEIDVSPWQEFAESFYNAMKADQEGMWISLFVIILIVAVGVLNTILMSVLERTREYGVLKALGSRPSQIFQLVSVEVTIMAAGSIGIGVLIGLLANHLLSIYGISLPNEITYGGIAFKTMYAEINVRSLVIPAVTVLVSALLVAVFPALRAARTDPAKSMRHH